MTPSRKRPQRRWPGGGVGEVTRFCSFRAAHRARPSSSSTCDRLAAEDRTTSSAGDRAPSGIVLSREESEHVKDAHDERVIGPSFEQRARQSSGIDPAGEERASGLPRRARWEDLSPPRLPARDRGGARADHRLERLPAPRCRAVGERSQEHDHDAEIDAPIEEDERRRGVARPAAVATAAEASAPLAFVGQIARATTRLALVVADVKGGGAVAAALRLCDGGEISIELRQEPEEQLAPDDRRVQERLRPSE